MDARTARVVPVLGKGKGTKGKVSKEKESLFPLLQLDESALRALIPQGEIGRAHV